MNTRTDHARNLDTEMASVKEDLIQTRNKMQMWFSFLLCLCIGAGILALFEASETESSHLLKRRIVFLGGTMTAFVISFSVIQLVKFRMNDRKLKGKLVQFIVSNLKSCQKRNSIEAVLCALYLRELGKIIKTKLDWVFDLYDEEQEEFLNQQWKDADGLIKKIGGAAGNAEEETPEFFDKGEWFEFQDVLELLMDLYMNQIKEE